MKNKISIITPVYNAEKYIRRCVKSVLQQNYKNFEMIIVNDGSTDSTASILDELKKTDDRIIVIHKANEGVSKARNIALKKASGEWISFVDADDFLEIDMYEKILENIDDKIDVIVCGYNNFMENTQEKHDVILKEYPNKTFLEVITDDVTLYGGFPWNKMMRKTCLKKGFNEEVSYYENLLFFVENFQNDVNYKVIAEPLYNYSINDTSAVHSKKYSIRKLTSLMALKKVIPLLPENSTIEHKYVFIMNYYNNYYNIKNQKIKNTNILEYRDIVKQYYKEIIKSKKISKKSKIKLFILYKMNFIYSIYKKIK